MNKMNIEKEQKLGIEIIETWRPNEYPEYRGFRCANCQEYKNEAWYHWINTDGFRLPIHMCEKCESAFQEGTIKVNQKKRQKVDRKKFGNNYNYTQDAKKRFREIISSWPTYKNPQLKSYTCDDCNRELDIDENNGQRKGYHVWWKMDDGETLSELHFHKSCGHRLGIYGEKLQSIDSEEYNQTMTNPHEQASKVTPAFKEFSLPTGETMHIPLDLELKAPNNSQLDPDRLHFLIYIPWDDKYLQFVTEEYKDFFQASLPHLHARTTDVHIARCMPFVKELVNACGKEVDERVINIAFILHDSGWSQMDEKEIASSLGVKGLALTDEAMGPKEKHAVLGEKIAREVLESYQFNPPLTAQQKDIIYKSIRFHDKPWELAQNGKVPLEVKLVCDVDHLWSFTHDNFWQDTVRKGVDPKTYLENLAQDLDGYFTTEEGKNKARALLFEREKEVKVLIHQNF